MAARRRALWAGAGAAVALAGAACMPPAPEVSGRALYADYCAACHGDGGRGDGPAAAGLTPPPVDLTRLSAGNAGVFPTAQVMSYVDGYTRSDVAGMPEFGDLLDGPRIPFDTGDGIPTPTPEPLVALAEYLRSLQR